MAGELFGFAEAAGFAAAAGLAPAGGFAVGVGVVVVVEVVGVVVVVVVVVVDSTGTGESHRVEMLSMGPEKLSPFLCDLNRSYASVVGTTAASAFFLMS